MQKLPRVDCEQSEGTLDELFSRIQNVSKRLYKATGVHITNRIIQL